LNLVELLGLLEVCRPISDVVRLYVYASINRIGFFYLYRLNECGYKIPPNLINEFERGFSRFIAIQKVFIDVSNKLKEIGINFAIFKSFRPYPSTTVDVDVIIFDDLLGALKHLIECGYRVIGSGPESITLCHPSGVVNIDLYRRISISRIAYLDKDVMKDHTTDIDVENGKVRVLRPEADIIAFANHAIIKEQLFTLADYLTITKLLRKSNIDLLAKLIELTHSKTVFSIVNYLIRQIAYSLRTHRDLISLPYKINPLLTLYALSEKFEEKDVKNSIVWQFHYMVKPRNLSTLMSFIVNHLTRITY